MILPEPANAHDTWLSDDAIMTVHRDTVCISCNIRRRSFMSAQSATFLSVNVNVSANPGVVRCILGLVGVPLYITKQLVVDPHPSPIKSSRSPTLGGKTH